MDVAPGGTAVDPGRAGLDHDRCYGAVRGRDPRFDGMFVTAVRTTGIYCRPSCPARTPKPSNVDFFPSAAAAQGAGFRACKRCRPDASPGSPEWNVRADVVGRAMRLIADGLVDREGVPALARRLGYSERHLHRLLLAEVGAGALALARSQRAQNARVLIETTALPMVDVAFAAGFASLRQFNDTVREVFDASPSELRAARPGGADPAGPAGPAGVQMSLRLPVRSPFAATELWEFLAVRAIPGVADATASGDAARHRIVLDLPRGAGVVDLMPGGDHVTALVRLADVRDLTAAVARCRRLLDLDTDPIAVDERLSADPVLGPLVAATPGLRSPGATSGFEVAVRAVVGQQVSLRGSITLLGRLAARFGDPVDERLTADGPPAVRFPAPERLAAADPAELPLPRARARALVGLAEAVASGHIELDPGADRAATRSSLLALEGIGPWTADYVAMRALGDPDVLLSRDLVVARSAAALGLGADRAEIVARSAAWAPWRSTVTHHLWRAAAAAVGAPRSARSHPTPTPDRIAR